MKRFLIAVIVTSVVALNSIAFAAEEGTTVDAGITPDSILYTADKLFEDLQLAFASSTEEEAQLLLQFAQERLSEAKEMWEQDKTQFVETAINDYTATLEQAQNAVLEVVVDESQDQEVKEELIAELEDTAVVDEEITENLDEEQQQEVQEATEQVTYTANVVRNIDAGVVTALREQGFGFGQIAHVVVLAEKSGKSVEEIASLVKEDKKGIGEVAKELGVHPSEMKPKSLKAAEAAPAEGEEENPTEEASSDTDEYASVVYSVQQTIASAITINTETTKPVEETKIQTIAKAQPVKKVIESTAKAENIRTDAKAAEEKKVETTQSQDKKAEETKVQQPAGAEKVSAPEAPKQNEVKKEESKGTDSSKTEPVKSEASKGDSGGSSSSSGGGNSSNNGGGNGKNN